MIGAMAMVLSTPVTKAGRKPLCQARMAVLSTKNIPVTYRVHKPMPMTIAAVNANTATPIPRSSQMVAFRPKAA